MADPHQFDQFPASPSLFDPGVFESCVLAFERAWQHGRPVEIEDWLPAAEIQRPGEQQCPEDPRQPMRLRLLFELICVDLEYRWRNASEPGAVPLPWTLGDYLHEFPELGCVDELPLTLIAEEYRARKRWGRPVEHKEFLARFKRRQGAIGELLVGVDRELQDELEDDLKTMSVVVAPGSSEPLDLAPDPRAPLFYGDYLLQRLAGSGRMGKVYQAWQRSLDRLVAVKYLRKSFLNDTEAVECFIGEARTVARFRHPGIVGIHGLGRTPSGGYFIVMDLIAGPDLSRIIKMGPVPVADAVRWTIEACEAIEHAHEHGIVHCDLKPGNLLLDRNRHVHVTDFGLARSLVEDRQSSRGIEGTAAFMAPEQVSRWWGPIGQRTDVYGLGAVLYTLLTGRPPYLGARLADVLAQAASSVPVVAPRSIRPDIPESLDRVCLRCLAKAPDERFSSMRELRERAALVVTRRS